MRSRDPTIGSRGRPVDPRGPPSGHRDPGALTPGREEVGHGLELLALSRDDASEPLVLGRTGRRWEARAVDSLARTTIALRVDRDARRAVVVSSRAARKVDRTRPVPAAFRPSRTASWHRSERSALPVIANVRGSFVRRGRVVRVRGRMWLARELTAMSSRSHCRAAEIAQ